ncbi:MAG: amidase [Gammaproteobacteria bacterium]|nr:amidase [Gammaproteobacteria bacterium]NIR84967.1 amidase [Gammaproteobacteria bacterium]NIR91816.1 amidase [Gammaproteobacteria bacterium]NIU06014.1 amidase [Gammaproteobacteria bacterium]NIV53061.1 amidase [Gammaproteobacteria bacterium]
MTELTDISALQAAELIGSGRMTSEELVQACLDRIEESEETIRAWAHLDRNYALEQARRADQRRKAGGPLGPLHGIPVGVKDIFDTADMPTEDGTVLHAARRPQEDATAVSLLRAAGAVIMGKTVTTELAVYSPGATRNPHDTSRTPGGSSSGSAAAVAANMVPLAIGSQTNGSIIRPAAFCGVCGYKPSYGLISRHRVLQQSRHLDHVGVFGRTVEDVALLAQEIVGFDENDPDTRPRARFRLLESAQQAPPVEPKLAFVKTPVWHEAEEDTQKAFTELVEFLGDDIEHFPLPDIFSEGIGWHRLVFEADLARSFRREYQEGKERLSAVLREMIERGRSILAVDYNDALYGRDFLRAALPQIFEHYDAILTPSAPGEAPAGLESTGSPVFCTLWTLCGAPAISLPLLRGADGMPMGAQLVGPWGDDERLLRTARWLAARVAVDSGDEES